MALYLRVKPTPHPLQHVIFMYFISVLFLFVCLILNSVRFVKSSMKGIQIHYLTVK